MTIFLCFENCLNGDCLKCLCTLSSCSIKFFLVPVSEAQTMLANLGKFTVAWHTNFKKSQQLERLAVKSHDEFLAEVSCEMPRSPTVLR